MICISGESAIFNGRTPYNFILLRVQPTNLLGDGLDLNAIFFFFFTGQIVQVNLFIHSHNPIGSTYIFLENILYNWAALTTIFFDDFFCNNNRFLVALFFFFFLSKTYNGKS